MFICPKEEQITALPFLQQLFIFLLLKISDG